MSNINLSELSVPELMFIETLLTVFGNDFDFTSLYPSIMRALNMARQTMIFAVLEIDNMSPNERERYLSNVINAKENAILLGKVHGFPDYNNILTIFDQMLQEEI